MASVSTESAPARRSRLRIILWSAGLALLTLAALLVGLIGADVSDEVLAGVAAAVVTGVVSFVLGVMNAVDREREAFERLRTQDRDALERTRSRQEENVLRALEYFTGKSQRRNVGIAIVEGYWQSTPYLRPVLIPLLANQAVYLLEESGQEDSAHEVDNWRRIVRLLATPGENPGGLERYYRQVLHSVERKMDGSPTAPDGGGLTIPAEELQDAVDMLRARLGRPESRLT